MVEGDWRRLAEMAKAERERQGLTQEELAGKGGPSTASLRLIEGALQTSYRGRTLRQLEEALGWQRGSVVAILQGGDPVTGGAMHNTSGSRSAGRAADVAELRNRISDAAISEEVKRLLLAALDMESPTRVNRGESA